MQVVLCRSHALSVWRFERVSPREDGGHHSSIESSLEATPSKLCPPAPGQIYRRLLERSTCWDRVRTSWTKFAVSSSGSRNNDRHSFKFSLWEELIHIFVKIYFSFEFLFGAVCSCVVSPLGRMKCQLNTMNGIREEPLSDIQEIMSKGDLDWRVYNIELQK